MEGVNDSVREEAVLNTEKINDALFSVEIVVRISVKSDQ